MTVSIGGTTGVTFPDASVQNTAATGFGFKSRIINGAMVIDQRNAGASVTQTTGDLFPVDRFRITGTVTSKFTGQRSTTAPAGFTNSLLITSLAATSLAAGDYYTLNQSIEGFNTADLAWGTASAQSVTLSFWVRSSLTGTFGGSLYNSAANRSYPFSYTISAANTWEQKTITIAGDTSGTWLTDNGVGVVVRWGLGVGSTYSGIAGAWAGALYLSATGATSVVGTSGATFYITGVQLEKGSTATAFDYRPYGTELALCQRYYQAVSGLTYTFYSALSATQYLPVTLQTEMRAAPTATIVNATPLSAGTTGVSTTSKAIVYNVTTGSATGGRYGFDSGSFTFSAEL